MLFNRNISPFYLKFVFHELQFVKVSLGSSKVFRGESISTECLAFFFETVKDKVKRKYTHLLVSEWEGHFVSFSLFCCKKRVKSWSVAGCRKTHPLNIIQHATQTDPWKQQAEVILLHFTKN